MKDYVEYFIPVFVLCTVIHQNDILITYPCREKLTHLNKEAPGVELTNRDVWL